MGDQKCNKQLTVKLIVLVEVVKNKQLILAKWIKVAPCKLVIPFVQIVVIAVQFDD